MGYRSNGYFIIPAQYSAELGRRVDDYLIAEKATRVKDKAQADKDGKHYIYSSTDPWNPLTGFDGVIEMKDDEGNLYHKYEFEGWKWYAGYDFPGIVERLLYEISEPDEYLLDSPEDTFLDVEYTPIYQGAAINLPTLTPKWTAIEGAAIFVRSGEDWNDVVVTDSTDRITEEITLDSPYSSKVPQMLIMLNSEDVEPENMIEFGSLLRKLTLLSPNESGEPWQEGERYFYWDTSNSQLWKEITSIFENAEPLGGFGWGLNMGSDDIIDELHANGGSHWDSDVYPYMGWDDSNLGMNDTGSIFSMIDLFPDSF